MIEYFCDCVCIDGVYWESLSQVLRVITLAALVRNGDIVAAIVVWFHWQ